MILDVDERGIREQMVSHGHVRNVGNDRQPFRDKIFMNIISKRFSALEKKIKVQKDALNSVQEIVQSLRD